VANGTRVGKLAGARHRWSTHRPLEDQGSGAQAFGRGQHREILRRALAEGSAAVRFGALRVKIRIAPDFDETPAEVIDAMEHGDY
jgi:hypothetical protein